VGLAGGIRDPVRFAATQAAHRSSLVIDGLPRPSFRARHAVEAACAWGRGLVWPFSREEPNGNHPFYAVVAMAGEVLTPAGRRWRGRGGVR